MVIATLEAWAMLLAPRAFFPAAHRHNRTRLSIVTFRHGQKGERITLQQAVTSRYPLSALLMEFSGHLRRSGVRPDVLWRREK